jgi:hypothetical protein
MANERQARCDSLPYYLYVPGVSAVGAPDVGKSGIDAIAERASVALNTLEWPLQKFLFRARVV